MTQSNSLDVRPGVTATFRFPVKTVDRRGDVLVVVLEVPPQESMTENVFGVSAADGAMLWQVERVAMTGTNPVNRYLNVLPADGADHAWLYNWNGADVLVDVRTGRVIRAELGK